MRFLNACYRTISVHGVARDGSRTKGVPSERNAYLRYKLEGLDVKGLSDELLTKRPQLCPVVAVQDMRGDLLISNRIVVQVSTVGLFNSRVDHGGDERSRSFGCASERRQSDGTAIEITQCYFK